MATFEDEYVTYAESVGHRIKRDEDGDPVIYDQGNFCHAMECERCGELQCYLCCPAGYLESCRGFK